VEGVQITPIIKCQTKEIISDDIVFDIETPSSAVLLHTSTLYIDFLVSVADNVVSRIAERHFFDVLKYTT